MSETWKIQDYISRPVALAFYLLVAGCYVVVAILGLVEQFFAQQLILPILSLTLVQICAVISLGFIAVVLQWYRVKWLSALLLLALALALCFQPPPTEQELSGIPLAVLVFFLVLVAITLLWPISQRFSQYLWYCLAACAFSYGVYLQLALWCSFLSIPSQTPYSSSLLPLLFISGGVALALRQHFALVVHKPLSRSTLVAIVMFQAGYAVWFTLTIYDIKYETAMAEQKTQQVVEQVEAQLQVTQSLFNLATERWQRVASERRMAFMVEDLTALTDSYSIIYGVIVFDEMLTATHFTGQAESFYQQGLLNHQALQAWIKAPPTNFRLATNSASLVTQQPFLMLTLKVNIEEQYVPVLVMINLQQALITENTYSVVHLKIYLEVLPDLLLAADQHGFHRSSLHALVQRYPYYFKVASTEEQWRRNPFYIFVSDLTGLHSKARLQQIVLWVALIFCCTFILAADRTRQLQNGKAKLSRMAKFDDITGLLRRDAFYEAAERQGFSSNAKPEAMIFIDLDGFKPINDSFGHDVGDQLLAEIADRIRLLVGEQSLLARFSGDEFLVYLPNFPADKAETLAQNVLSAIAKPSHSTGFNVYLTASIGILINTLQGRSPQLLTQLADVAMSYAKQAGGNTFRFYQQVMSEDYRHTMALRNRLQAALDDKQLQVFYQPVLEFASGKVVAIESLVRWQDDGKYISPAEFIPIAEQTGQIIQLGEQVTEIVLRDLAEQPQLQSLHAAINVSSQQLRRYDYFSYLTQALIRFSIPASRICIELTESAILEEQNNSMLMPERIKQLGCLLALDDFGTGYSSLSYLYRLPADVIKLDRSFTQDLLNDVKQRQIVEMIVNTCKQIGKTVVIEGVETQEMAALCEQLGCDRVQGYFYARPMPLADLLLYLNAKETQ